MYDQPENSMHQVPYWESKNITCQCTKFSWLGDLVTRICARLHYSMIKICHVTVRTFRGMGVLTRDSCSRSAALCVTLDKLAMLAPTRTVLTWAHTWLCPLFFITRLVVLEGETLIFKQWCLARKLIDTSKVSKTLHFHSALAELMTLKSLWKQSYNYTAQSFPRS